jgi:hypothetical protein
MDKNLTAELLREILTYNPKTGIFRWKADRSARIRAGAVAGTITKTGYRRINIDGTQYPAHRELTLQCLSRSSRYALSAASGSR